jgi:ferredoxin
VQTDSCGADSLLPAVLPAAAGSAQHLETAGTPFMGKKTIAPLQNPPKISDQARCSGCGRCVAACPEKLYTLQTDNYRKYSRNKAPENCTLCGKCLLSCPLEIIRS